jgi:allantoicase
MTPAYDDLVRCCGSTAWAHGVVESAPYDDLEDLLARGRERWWSLDPADWHEAFAAHPRIGGRPPEGSQESREQSTVADADSRVLAALAEGNLAYEEKYGFTYIVRAAGRSPEELLGLLLERLDSDPGTELVEAAAQQWEITELRLRTLVGVS